MPSTSSASGQHANTGYIHAHLVHALAVAVAPVYECIYLHLKFVVSVYSGMFAAFLHLPCHTHIPYAPCADLAYSLIQVCAAYTFEVRAC